MQAQKSIVVLDFGGQYAHLIASRVRRLGAHSVILPAETPAAELADSAGIILSGGPQSVYDPNSPQADPALFDLGLPVLGICYGLQWLTKALGGEVSSGHVKEYGHTDIRTVDGGGVLLQDCGDSCTVWMSHGDEATRLPDGFSLIGTSDACTNAAFADEDRHFYAVQFHPEVTHSEHGTDMLRRFVSVCDATPWEMSSYADRILDEIRTEVGDRNVFMLVSGGVDSSVAFALLNKALGADRVQGMLVDHGLMRKNEAAEVKAAFDTLGITNLHVVDASQQFFANLTDVYEPEAKRQVIGNTFLDVQRQVSEEMGLSADSGWMLGQGTIYPDTIETGATKHADKIKTHHNRVEAVQAMIDAGLVIEPLKDLYKDEVRQLGEEIGLPHDFVWRHPFPGPGLGVRILCGQQPVDYTAQVDTEVPHAVLPVKSVGVQGDGRTYRQALALFSDTPCNPSDQYWKLSVSIPNKMADFSRVLLCTSQQNPPDSWSFTPGYLTRERADMLREADAIVHEEMQKGGLYESIWQFPVVLVPFGVDAGQESVVLRPIASTDAMTANAVRLPAEVLTVMTKRIMAISGIDAVFLDMTNKPPGTIEWE